MVPTLSDRIAHLLRDDGHHAAAWIVEHGQRCDTAAAAIADDLVPFGRTVTVERRALAELVRAWGARHDVLALQALAVWDVSDCAACALRVLQGLQACADCAEAA